MKFLEKEALIDNRCFIVKLLHETREITYPSYQGFAYCALREEEVLDRSPLVDL